MSVQSIFLIGSKAKKNRQLQRQTKPTKQVRCPILGANQPVRAIPCHYLHPRASLIDDQPNQGSTTVERPFICCQEMGYRILPSELFFYALLSELAHFFALGGAIKQPDDFIGEVGHSALF